MRFPTTYDDNVNEEDPIEEPLASDLKEEYKEDDQLEEEELTDNIADYEEVDKDLSGEVPNFNDEEVDYVDFLGIEDILLQPSRY